MTVTSACIPEEAAYFHVCILGLTHKGCAFKHRSFAALSDVTVVLGMGQSIDTLRVVQKKGIDIKHLHFTGSRAF